MILILLCALVVSGSVTLSPRSCCKAKQILQRPLPGIAHALVFWGFCAFAVITIKHFTVGLNTSVLDRHVLAGKFY